jgi:hypothetical protein
MKYLDTQNDDARKAIAAINRELGHNHDPAPPMIRRANAVSKSVVMAATRKIAHSFDNKTV